MLESLHIYPRTIFLISILGLGIGLSLIIQHLGAFYKFDPIWMDPFGHEWIGLYIVIICMILISITG